MQVLDCYQVFSQVCGISDIDDCDEDDIPLASLLEHTGTNVLTSQTKIFVEYSKHFVLDKIMSDIYQLLSTAEKKLQAKPVQVKSCANQSSMTSFFK